ncbi:nitronate monooxygenase [Pseudomonas schmalbachii]|uniref:Nitronate monooxygenase n=1 Tax=Pseudomonas schmalbachii TaxID=2816993 RepID=A0ABS3TLU5_9PSED|nr:nitronate monooxygenase [Pseudomonas schmalbachii]MBO3273675.1 nitronate monooxygenase [Pseudomonas schmalbachii]
MPHPALHTPLVDLLGCRVPIICAGMGGVARHELAAVVGNAGGFGCLGMVREPVELIRREVQAYRALSENPFAVNLIPAATPGDLLAEQVAACLDLQVPAMALFWDVQPELIRRLKDAGVLVLQQVGRRSDAEAAIRAGVDVLIAQGVEAGGHVWGDVSTLALVPELVALGEVPVVACGGIGNGNALVAALALGAQGVACGSAFLATTESYAHDYHKQRLVEAGAEQTLLTTAFFRNWPMPAPVRVLPNAVTRGEYADLHARGDTPVIGEQDGGPIHLFSTDSPLRGAQGRLEDMPIYAGQSCAQLRDIRPAAERLARMVEEAEACLARLQGAADSEADLVDWLQELLRAERAGARVMVDSAAQTEDPQLLDRLHVLHRGEAESCRRLRRSIEYLGAEPCRELGAFHARAMAIDDLAERLQFIARGQRWVARRLSERLPHIRQAWLRQELKEVLRLHRDDPGS